MQKCLHLMLYKLVCYLVFSGGIQYVHGELLITSGCNCVGYTTTFQCTTTGNGVTKWRGTALHCPHLGNEIGLNNEKFSDPDGTSKRCGETIGRSIRVEGNSYTSQLMVPINFELSGSTIECVYEDLITNAMSLIGRIRLNLTTEAFSPPNNVHLADAGQGKLSFSWSTVANNCASLQYEINTTCGVCPDVTNATSVSCAISDTVSHIPKVCSFAVRSVVCGDVIGQWNGHPTHLTLKVPDAPSFTGIQASYDANGLTGLNVTYKGSTKDMFNISRDIGGDVHNFTIGYSDGLTNHSCTPLTTSSLNSSLPQSCFPALLLNNSITVSVSASNRLGKGPKNKTVIAATNEYVNLIPSPERIICHGRESYNVRSCSASYGECGNPKQWKTSLGNTTESPTIVNIYLYPHSMREYCYEVIATVNNLTVIIRGGHSYINKGGDGARLPSKLIAAIISIFVTILLSAVILTNAIIIIVKVYQRYHVHTRGFHAIVELLDEPWQFLNLLQGVKDFNISINDTEISGCTSKKTRRIYLRFDQDLSDGQAELVKRQIDERISPSAEMMYSKVIKTNELEITDDRWTCSLFNGSYFKTYTYSRQLPPRPGALCTLIEGIRTLSSTEHGSYDGMNVNIVGIAGTPKEQGDVLIHLRFICDRRLPRS